MNGLREKTPLEKLEEQAQILKAYLYSKADQEDWHAVSDAANDLRVIGAKMEAQVRIQALMRGK